MMCILRRPLSNGVANRRRELRVGLAGLEVVQGRRENLGKVEPPLCPSYALKVVGREPGPEIAADALKSRVHDERT